jgi:enoyl-CoA hydratase/carnithine racemase
MAAASFETLELSKDGSAGLITVNRPKALNALNSQVMSELVAAAKQYDNDSDVGCIVVTGSGKKAFAAGADIREMAPMDSDKAFRTNMLGQWQEMQNVRKPMIAAVNGFALGGGCELAMMCDIILASDNAQFGQPEITLGVIPGMGGTQRLVRAIGKSRAMEMVLSGRKFTAQEAADWGLVSRVVPQDQLLPEAIKLANQIGELGHDAVAKAKDAVNRAYQMSLSEGLNYELRAFWSCFGTADQQEGMKAFLEKRKPEFNKSKL